MTDQLRDAAQALLSAYDNGCVLNGDIAALRAALSTPARHLSAIAALQARIAELQAKLNTPELHDFSAAVVLEAAHQRERWGASHDVGKQPADWFWLLGYLGGKALNAAVSGNADKALHHTISTAAACANWHASISGKHTQMRPGIDPVERGVEAAPSNPTP